MSLPRFILNDETACNSHGFYLLNAGGRLDRFAANPVMLDNHDMNRLVGRWTGVVVEAGRLMAEPDFDEGTELGKERKGQVERGYLKGASIGLYIRAAEYRTNPATGESELYVTDWEMLEASVTPLPSNAGALSLKIYDAENQPIPDGGVELYLESVVKLGLNTKNKIHMPTISNPTGEASPVILSAAAQVALGISDATDSAAISAAVISLSARVETAEAARAKLEKEASEAREKACREMIALAVKEGRIAATLTTQYEALAVANYDATKAALAAMPVKGSLSAQVQGAASASVIPAERQGWNLHAWMQKDMPGLQKLKVEDPDRYAEILKQV